MRYEVDIVDGEEADSRESKKRNNIKQLNIPNYKFRFACHLSFTLGSSYLTNRQSNRPILARQRMWHEFDIVRGEEAECAVWSQSLPPARVDLLDVGYYIARVERYLRLVRCNCKLKLETSKIKYSCV